MKRRLRKKLRLGEFVELGFGVKIVWQPDMDPEYVERITWDFVTKCIEPLGLFCGGGGGAKGCVYFITRRRSSCTDMDQEHVFEWLARHIDDQAKKVLISRLVDAWHCTDAQYDALFERAHKEKT